LIKGVEFTTMIISIKQDAVMNRHVVVETLPVINHPVKNKNRENMR
jgi:hypothetical protein